MSTATRTNVRLAELVATLSLGTDLGMAQPMEHALRQSLIALRMAERLGLDESERVVVYYVGLLAWVGCHVDAYEQAKWFGDDTVFKGEARQVDMGRPLSAGAFVLGHLGSDRPLIQRALTGIAFLGDGRRAVQDMMENHWVATNELAAGLELGDDVRDSLYQTFERWDGKGAPAEARGAQIRVAARLVNLADVVEVFHRAGGIEAAIGGGATSAAAPSSTPRSSTCSAPRLRRCFADLDAATSWDAVIAAEPALARRPLRRAARRLAGGDRRLRRHQVAVDDRPFARGRRPGGGGGARPRAVRRTTSSSCDEPGCVHDLGRLGVSNAIWDKRGPLTAAETERVRLHPYLTERMLASSAGLAPLGAIAVQHHERLDGSGYPRGLHRRCDDRCRARCWPPRTPTTR